MTCWVIGGRDFASHLRQQLVRLKVTLREAADESALPRRGSGGLVVLDDDTLHPSPARRETALRRLRRAGWRTMLVSSDRASASILGAAAAGASDYVVRPYHTREFILRFNALRNRQVRITCIGGGTGLFTLLLGLKGFAGTLLTSIVAMSDDGGSSGKLSQAYGVLPPGDVRRSLVALSNAPEIMNRIIQYRFGKGSELQEHSFGNLFLAALVGVTGSMSEAVRALSDILNIQGIVLPATMTPTCLVARFEDGTQIRGESRIDLCVGRKPELKIRRLWHEPPPQCDPNGLAAILFSDLVTIGPGDLFTSILATLALEDIRLSLERTRARVLYICNLMTKPGETHGYRAADHLAELRRYLKGDRLDYAVISDTELSAEAISEYAKKGQQPVIVGPVGRLRRVTRAKILLADVGNETELVRHDSAKLARVIRQVLRREFGRAGRWP